MTQFKFVLVIILLISAGLVSAQNVAVGFKDTTTSTKTLVNLEFGTPTEYPNGYPFPTPASGFGKWLVQFYRTTNDIIDPVTITGEPTGDDIEVLAIPPNYTQGLSFGPNGALALSACTITPVGSTGNTHVGDKIYLRIFNANTKTAATKTMAFTAPYIVTANTTQNVTIIPTYGWGAWTIMGVSAVPNPAVLILPADAATGIGYAPQTLSWTAGTGVVPTGFKVYFGTDNPPTNIDNGTTQTSTTYVTGSLLQNQTYYWKIVPYNTTGDALDCPIWSFTTRVEINPEQATNPIPANESVIEYAEFPVNQILSWSAPVSGQAPSGYKLFWNQASTPEDLGNVLTVTKSLAVAGTYVWQIVPYYIDPGTRAVRMGQPIAARASLSNNMRGDAVSCPIWSFTANQAITYTVDITSDPSNANILVNGLDSGFDSPHQFQMIQGSSAEYSVQKAGYNFMPLTYSVTNIQAAASQNFVGTIQTFTVDVTSDPNGARIYVDGNDSGYNAPHQFVMNYGTSATYSVQMPGYNWSQPYVVTNIQANDTIEFLGTILTYTVDITSNPANANIFIDGIDSGFTTPYQFIMDYGTSATYTVTKAGYTFAPEEFVVTNIQANASQNFTGTIHTFTVDITSVPTGANIMVGGMDSGFVTPYQFVMDYGTSAIYTVQKAGYSFAPANLVVNNIQSNVVQDFTGSILTYTVDIISSPSGADIFVDGVDSGFETPYQFVMNYGTSAVYTVQKAGYTWLPANFTVTNIQASTSQNFMGTIITYTVDITSTPTNADIFIDGVDSGFNTPYQFVMDYGSSAVYTVQKPGYAWIPDNFVVTNILADTAQDFVGTQNLFFVDITSTPADADIFVNGIDSGFNTPHQFALAYGANATYTVQKAGYTFAPDNYVVTNIQTDLIQNFIGTINTYTIDISSNQTDADIFVNGVDSGFNTPHQFVMNYGTSAVYSVQKTGYSFLPAELVINNIQENTVQEFIGSLLTYTVNITSYPTGADIFAGGIDTGFNTPHQFVLEYGTGIVYSVQKEGYTWQPDYLGIEYITSDMSQEFIGTIITFTVDITSNPSDADIYVGGIDTGFNTPHTFVMNYGTSAIYTIQKDGYTWEPVSYVVENITENDSQEFIGTIITYTVDITSYPPNADIFVDGIDTGFNTPHQFVMNYGTNALYTVQKAGYSWAPSEFVITNIQANTMQDFVGTLLTYTVDITSNPPDAAVFVNGNYSGFNTPHQFVLDYGTGAVYTVQKAGYNFEPVNYVVTNIQANAGQEFIGTIITYTVNITSVPPGADIFVDGIDSGFNTPYQFVMDYGTGASYTVQKTGYNYQPQSFVVNNIQANTTQNFVGSLITYSVDITSSPSGADIYIGGIDSGFNTPHTFILSYGTSVVYSVKKAGYTWSPANYEVSNIQANASNEFIGTLISYTVDILSNPSNAEIYIGGQYTGFNTPHQFVMDYGTSAVYTVQKAGYTWTPINFNVTNIHANTSQMFTGTIITYNVILTSNPGNADIYINGIDSGFNTPYQFTMAHGSSAIYSVQKAGYSFDPSNYIVSNIQANAIQNFDGSLLTYTVSLTSNPSDADVFVGGVDTGLNTPCQFVLNYGATVTYTVNKLGYSWSPASYTVTNIQANTGQNFTGTILTYTVNIQSIPSGADIFVGGIDTGFNTPNSFSMTYGASAVYTVQMAGYIWTPTSYTVSNIQANASHTFAGISAMISVTPANQNVSASAGITSFRVNSNIPWTVSSNVSWLTPRELIGINDGRIIVDYITNPTNLTRTGQLTISGNGIYRVVTISQMGGMTFISVTPSNQNVSASAGTASFAVSSNTQWTVSESASWLSVSQVSGSLNGNFNVLYEANPSTHPREAKIYLSAHNRTRTIVITQAGAQATLSVTPTLQNVTYEMGTTSFSITSNVAWSVSETANWLYISPMTGNNNGTIVVHYNANTTTAARSAQITVTGNNVTQIVTITQGSAPAGLNVTPEIQYVSSLAGITSFSVMSNTGWTISENETWLRTTVVSGNNNGVFSVVYEANPTTTARIGYVTVTWGESSRTVEVRQAAGIATAGESICTFNVYPNPFITSAKIEMDVTKGNAEVAIYSVKGQLVKSFGKYSKGNHVIEWNGKDASNKQCSNGYYFIRYKTAEQTKTIKVMLMKN